LSLPLLFVIVTAQLPLAQTNGGPDCIVDRAAMRGQGAASVDPALVTGQNTWTGTPSSSDSRKVIRDSFTGRIGTVEIPVVVK
jgi:hypothetical protein